MRTYVIYLYMWYDGQNVCVKFINTDFCLSYGNARPQVTEIAVGSADGLQQKTTKTQPFNSVADVCNNLNSTLTFSTLFAYSEDRNGFQNDKGEVIIKHKYKFKKKHNMYNK